MTSGPRKVALAFFAHPDDAEIFCGGTLWRLRHELGYQVHIATATAGDCGTADRSSWEIGSIRTGEAKAAAAMLDGAYHCLGELDGRVCYSPSTIAKAIELFRHINPSIIFTHPRHDYMIDHEQVHLLARAASFLYAAPNASSIPTPSGASVPSLFYTDPLGGVDPYTGEPTSPDIRVDVAGIHDRKIAMLACHSSQREWLRAHHGIDEYLDAVRRHDAIRGMEAGVCFAEGFTRHKGHAYPVDNVLFPLLPKSRHS